MKPVSPQEYQYFIDRARDYSYHGHVRPYDEYGLTQNRDNVDITIMDEDKSQTIILEWLHGKPHAFNERNQLQATGREALQLVDAYIQKQFDTSILNDD